MAQTTGRVQRLKVTAPPVLAWVYIGPAPNNTQPMYILQPELGPEEAAFRASMVDVLSTALVSGQEVIASHDANSAEITLIEMRAT